MSKTRHLLAILLAAATVSSVFADAARRPPRPPVDELALKGHQPPAGAPIVHPEDTVSYGGDTTGATTWNRPFADCTGQSSLGPVTFQVQPFHVDTTGSYDISSVQAGWDGFIFVYQSSFDPNNGNANCLEGNDDGGAGIGTSEIFGLPLVAGGQYLLVTTGFEAGEEGTYTNQIAGPGGITLGALGGEADLSIVKTGEVPAAGAFPYQLAIANAGPDAASGVVVTDNIPTGLTYVSDTCGGSAAGQSWTWNAGSLPAGGAASCALTVSIDLPEGCQPFINTARIASGNFDPDLADNASTASNATEGLADGGFEDGSPSIEWIEESTNFGTPLCTVDDCGTGTGTGPHSGDWWAWFGGIAAPETGSLSQTVTLPEGSHLTFWFEAPVCADPTDFVRVQIDGVTVWEATGVHPQCNNVGYTLQNVDISAFDDGASHNFAIVSTISGNPTGSNFFIDDLSTIAVSCPENPNEPPNNQFDIAVPALSEIGLLAMAVLLAAGALILLHRR